MTIKELKQARDNIIKYKDVSQETASRIIADFNKRGDDHALALLRDGDLSPLSDTKRDLDLNESINPGEPSEGQNYEILRNKPSINSVELIGNLTTEDLKLDYGSLPDKPTINSTPVDGDLTLEDFGVGTASMTDINRLFN